jgi:hypothetical protein
MSERSSGPSWVMVTLLAALIGSPLVLRFFESRGVVAPEPSPEISVQVQLPEQLMSGAGRPAGVDRSIGPPKPQAAVRARSTLDTRTQYLSATDLLGFTTWELDILRNEIYARHGRRFNRSELQAYFDQQPWYVPRYPANGFPEHLLTAVERWNAELIADYQRTAGR